MNRIIIFIGIISLFYSCGSDKVVKDELKGFDSIAPVSEELITESMINEVVEEDSKISNIIKEGIIFTGATVLSIGEELIMPSDYLTIAMTVVTDNNDTLVFLNVNEEDVTIGGRILLNYEIKEEYRILVCFDCESYSEKVELFDITSFTNDVIFESLQLVKFNEDEYIIPASTFTMVNEKGNLEDFHSTDMSIVEDSLKMSSAFHFYGVVTKLYPQLITYETVKD